MNVDILAQLPERMIGQKQIIPVLKILYGIGSWTGALKFINANKLPLRETPSGRPMFLKHELVAFDAQSLQKLIKVDKKVKK